MYVPSMYIYVTIAQHMYRFIKVRPSLLLLVSCPHVQQKKKWAGGDYSLFIMPMNLCKVCL